MNVSIIGDGGWGTTLGILLRKKQCSVTMWGAFPDYIAQVARTRENKRYLPGIRIPTGIRMTADLGEAITKLGSRSPDVVILAVPSEYTRLVLEQMKAFDYTRRAIYVSVIKGIEFSSLRRMSELISAELGNIRFAVLSGPTIAHEVAAGVPTTAVVASKSNEVSRRMQSLFMCETLRVYVNNDIIGVELGGSLKNVIAIACGISDGLGFGTNTKAALLCRGIVEIARLGSAMGAQSKTFYGISGLGDLATTCFSPYSRNRYVGEQLGKGVPLEKIKKSMKMVAEGVPTARSAYKLSREYKVEMPITEQVHAVLSGRITPRNAVRNLMNRAKKVE